MPIEYIIAIICGSLFAVLFVTNAIVCILNAKKEARVREELEKMYADKNLVAMRYDFVAYDEEIEELTANAAAGDEIKPTAEEEQSSFSQMVIEGLEEITGDYKPE